jgi:hypothetical protein
LAGRKRDRGDCHDGDMEDAAAAFQP